MSLKSTTDRYGAMAISIHWLSAILILVLIATGLRTAGTLDPQTKLTLLRVHVPIAIAVLCLTALRIVWWWRFDRKPHPIPGMPAWQERIASVSHGLFYVLILGMAGSGIAMMVLSGALPVIFGGDSAALPDFSRLLPHVTHDIGGKVFIALLVLHIGAALYHHLVRRDGIFRRMGLTRQIP